jgi:hypothetical protein
MRRREEVRDQPLALDHLTEVLADLRGPGIGDRRGARILDGGDADRVRLGAHRTGTLHGSHNRPFLHAPKAAPPPASPPSISPASIPNSALAPAIAPAHPPLPLPGHAGWSLACPRRSTGCRVKGSCSPEALGRTATACPGHEPFIRERCARRVVAPGTPEGPAACPKRALDGTPFLAARGLGGASGELADRGQAGLLGPGAMTRQDGVHEQAGARRPRRVAPARIGPATARTRGWPPRRRLRPEPTSR